MPSWSVTTTFNTREETENKISSTDKSINGNDNIHINVDTATELQLQNKASNILKVCTPTTQSSFPSNVFTPVHDTCPLTESQLQSLSKIDTTSTTNTNTNCNRQSIPNIYTNIQCPNNEDKTQDIIDNGAMNEHIYLDRSAAGHCSETTGMWDKATLAQQKCYFLLGIQHMNVAAADKGGAQSQVWLDWGTGCSHQIFWLYQYYGYYGFGLDLIEANKQYAMKEFGNDGNGPVIGYCSGDATDLGYLRDGMFDNIIAIGAVLHLPEEKQCELVMGDFIRILKNGGRIWIGWNGNEGGMNRYKWEDCLKGYDGKYGGMEWEIVLEMETFGYTVYEHADTYSIFVTKK